MGEIKKYVGSCHCGNVRYSVSLDLSAPAVSCNCSICGRSGSLLTFVPAAQFTLERGEDALTDYQFNKKIIHHLFCSTCGVESFARGTAPDGSPTVAVNVRCLDNIDLSRLERVPFDGRSK